MSVHQRYTRITRTWFMHRKTRKSSSAVAAFVEAVDNLRLLLQNVYEVKIFRYRITGTCDDAMRAPGGRSPVSILIKCGMVNAGCLDAWTWTQTGNSFTEQVQR